MQFTELTNVSPEIIRATQSMGFTDMTEIQRTMLEAYFVDKASDFKDAGLPESPSAVELMSYMRTRYGISNEYSAEEMRIRP